MVMERNGSMRHTRDMGAVRSISVAVALLVGLSVHAWGQSRGIEVAVKASEGSVETVRLRQGPWLD